MYVLDGPIHGGRLEYNAQIRKSGGRAMAHYTCIGANVRSARDRFSWSSYRRRCAVCYG